MTDAYDRWDVDSPRPDPHEDLLDALEEFWVARCSRLNYAARGDEEAARAPYASFGATAAKARLYALCEEAWGKNHHREPVGARDPYGDA